MAGQEKKGNEVGVAKKERVKKSGKQDRPEPVCVRFMKYTRPQPSTKTYRVGDPCEPRLHIRLRCLDRGGDIARVASCKAVMGLPVGAPHFGQKLESIWTLHPQVPQLKPKVVAASPPPSPSTIDDKSSFFSFFSFLCFFCFFFRYGDLLNVLSFFRSLRETFSRK